ncbi:LysM-like peptidoglycan-binding domain-containing protein [Atlantibacter subterranea]|uniref:LysM-like peptidoglycan-binding domain-containing protein n=1 Tax=Atlantibacter subterraneus TaxID=255519 RepID=A0ABU4E143_9ENTR|nr:LysM-like peptidoglycan-binding domain-containing protein [Atlantibacter subterranea]MDV7022451.1 LysM-like peptidoglycan-binding domain-containing protein [Atlantibacter subterranea]MDZ5665649.1 LysM-like peptidoglycan-binding domain-containing protein [Atlantibacter hermannii]
MPGRFAIKPTLSQIWHAPDHIRLMDPLPPFHRRGIIIAALVIVICFLWPTAQPEQPQIRRDAQLDLQSSSQPPMQAELTTPPPQTQATQTPESEPAPAESAPQPFQNNDIEQQWRTYRVEEGKTMAQLFRDHNLPPADVYAMAQVEGDGKPLSTLQTGQMVQIRQNASGVVTGLTIDVGNDKQVLFTRQPDGSFIRVR